MTWYQIESATEAGVVTAYAKESGRRVNVDIYEDEYAEVPGDEDEVATDLLAESDHWIQVDDYTLPSEREPKADNMDVEGTEPEEEGEEEEVEETQQDEQDSETGDEAGAEEVEEPVDETVKVVTVNDLDNSSPTDDLPPLEDADLDELAYRELQAYASLFDTIRGDQSTEELVSELDVRR